MARKSKWAVKCGSVTRSKHRKKSAANKAKPAGCRVVHGGLGGLGSPKGRKHRGYKRAGRRVH